MVKVSTVRMESKAHGLIYKMIGIAEKASEDTFDSELFLSPDPMQNHSLVLTLNIFLKQIVSNKGLPAGKAKDADGDVFLVKPWEGQTWDSFKRLFREQARNWSYKFWLVPPDSYAGLDVGSGDYRRRPNVYCDLEINFVGNVALAHRTISVVNLDVTRLGKKISSATFRSHERLYDSLDTKERTNKYYDDLQEIQKHAHYLTIPHEIGHALGLPHIGVTYKDPQCMLAVMLDEQNFDQDLLPAMYTGGSNAKVCYGHGQSAKRSGNIMGGGTLFEKVNAQPWVDRIALHTRTDPKDWYVSLQKLNPGTF